MPESSEVSMDDLNPIEHTQVSFTFTAFKSLESHRIATSAYFTCAEDVRASERAKDEEDKNEEADEDDHLYKLPIWTHLWDACDMRYFSELLKSDDPHTKINAARRIAQVGDLAGISAICQALRRDTGEISYDLIDVLCDVGTPAVVPLTQVFHACVPDTRLMIVETLNMFNDARALNTLVSALTDDDKDVRSAAGAAISLIAGNSLLNAAVVNLARLILKAKQSVSERLTNLRHLEEVKYTVRRNGEDHVVHPLPDVTKFLRSMARSPDALVKAGASEILLVSGLKSNELQTLRSQGKIGHKPQEAAKASRLVHTTEAETKYTIPMPPEPKKHEFKLDTTRIQEKVAETAQVSELLGGIFVEDDTPQTVAPVRPEPAPSSAGTNSLQQTARTVDEPSLRDLDTPHWALLNVLARQAEWTRADVEATARALQLLPDGALETINDLAFDLCGEPIFEGDEPITVNKELLDELLK